MPGRKFLGVLSLVFVALPLYADPPGVYAITGGTVHPVSGPAIPNGIVVIRDGLIETVGANVTIPADATTIDAKGGDVYPGLIDAQTSLGLPAAASSSTGRRRRGGAQPPAEPAFETSADTLAARNVKLSDDDLETERALGVTTIAAIPSSGIFNGQSAVLDLGDGTPDSRIIRSPATFQVSFTPRPSWTYPDSLMGVISYIRQTMYDGQQYVAAHAIYDRNPGGYKRPDDNAALQAIAPVLRRDLPIVFVADSELMIRRAMAIAKEFNLRYIIAGGRQGYRMAPDLKDVPVLVSVKWPVAPIDKEQRGEQPLRVIRDRQLSPTTPSVLAKNGVLFALVSGDAKNADLIEGVRKAIENGLADDDALRALTLSPARILGVDRQLGTLERGKIANVVISDKPLFDKHAHVKHVFIDGREVNLAKESDKRGTRGSESNGISGAWSLLVKTPSESVSLDAALHADDGKLTGTLSGTRGSGDLRNGTYSGADEDETIVEFTITTKSGADTTADWLFHGTLRDGKLSGTVATPGDTYSFSGSKPK